MGQEEFYGEQYGHTQSSSEPVSQQYYSDGNQALIQKCSSFIHFISFHITSHPCFYLRLSSSHVFMSVISFFSPINMTKTDLRTSLSSIRVSSLPVNLFFFFLVCWNFRFGFPSSLCCCWAKILVVWGFCFLLCEFVCQFKVGCTHPKIC